LGSAEMLAPQANTGAAVESKTLIRHFALRRPKDRVSVLAAPERLGLESA